MCVCVRLHLDYIYITIYNIYITNWSKEKGKKRDLHMKKEKISTCSHQYPSKEKNAPKNFKEEKKRDKANNFHSLLIFTP